MVYNRSPAKAEPLAKQGARVAASPKALAQDAEVIIAMVTGSRGPLSDLLLGAGGARPRPSTRARSSST